MLGAIGISDKEPGFDGLDEIDGGTARVFSRSVGGLAERGILRQGGAD
jgi:hypothetical protein